VNGEETDQDTIVLYYNVECTNEKELKADGSEGYVNETAYSGSLTWVPQGDQEKIFPGIFVSLWFVIISLSTGTYVYNILHL